MNPDQQDYSFMYQGGPQNNSGLSAPKNKLQNLKLMLFSLLGVIVIAIIASVVVGIFKVDNSQKLTDLATYQNELQRVMDIGVKYAIDGNTKSLAQTASSTYGSHRQATITLATNKGVKITDKQLALGKSKTIDKTLESAKSANNFDEVFQRVYEEKLTEYRSKLNALSNAENDRSIKAALVNYLNNTSLMSFSYNPKNQ